MYVFLPVAAVARHLAYVMELRGGIDEGQDAAAHQPVADHGIGLLQ
jgi:hypothetical protein